MMVRMMIDPHQALLEVAGLDVTEGVGSFRARYLRDYGAGRVAKRHWDNPSFTLGFEYGFLALAALLEEIDRTDPEVAG